MVARRAEIESGELVVFMVDECHLLWEDICGYVWAAAFGGKLPPETCLGKASERVLIPVDNARDKQTYFGALNYKTKEFLIYPAKKANSETTISFIQYLQSQRPQAKLLIIWDGASYHRSQQTKNYLDSLNYELSPEQWVITCKRFAPNAPEQNPVEDIWLQAKRLIREFYFFCHSFSVVKA